MKVEHTLHLHILGIGGTFMAGLARLAVALGHRVTGSDLALYPPMSTQLEELGIEVREGYDEASLQPHPDLVVIGNALSRGNPCVEYVLNQDLPYTSGPQWIEQYVLPGRHVIAVAGTHGKTTVSGLVTWMLERAGLAPGFLIGGVLGNFGISARLGESRYFVIEADEYDTAFFDKRSKFVHYHPRTLVINNIEFDHADIFPDLEAIQRQFHHLIRTMPAGARIVRPLPEDNIDEVLALGCWSRVSSFGRSDGCDWRFAWRDGEQRELSLTGPDGATVRKLTPLMGLHNAWNVTAAASAVADAGVPAAQALDALDDFANVRRRLELRGERREIRVYDDFAHHPTAIAATIAALRGSADGGRILALLEPRSNTMVMGVHETTLAPALEGADWVGILVPDRLAWDIRSATATHSRAFCFSRAAALARAVVAEARAGDNILVMSNGAFGGIHEMILTQLENP